MIDSPHTPQLCCDWVGESKAFLLIEGVKKYELRLADFECNSGDILILKEWDQKTKKYTGRFIEKTVTSVLKTKNQTFWPKEEVEKYVFQIISFK